MKHYIFQFGRFPALSTAELRERVNDFGTIKEVCPGFYRTSGADIKTPQNFLDSLGGSIRMAEEINSAAEKKQEFGQLSGDIAQYLSQKFSDGKIQFGLSLFPEKKSELKKIALDTKKELKKMGRSVRCINRNFQNLDSGTLHREKIFRKKNGAEILILRTKNGPLLAQTLAAQNVQKFSERDYHKPERDMMVGMLPPKIALMLVNLSCIHKKLPRAIWDPFCGTGTVNIEAKRLGIETVGSDISPKMIDAAQKNYEHFFGNRGDFFVHDAAKKLSTLGNNSHQSPEVIVSEGYLGPIFGRPLSERDYKNATSKVEPIMRKFLMEASQRRGIQKIVICLPFWKLLSRREGFCEHVYTSAQKTWRLQQMSNTRRGTLRYRRKNQIVGREILILTR